MAERLPNYANTAYADGDSYNQPFGVWDPRTAVSTSSSVSRHENYTEPSYNHGGVPYARYEHPNVNNSEPSLNPATTTPDVAPSNHFSQQNLGQTWSRGEYYQSTPYTNQTDSYSPLQHEYTPRIPPVQQNSSHFYTQDTNYGMSGGDVDSQNFRSASAFKNPLLEEDDNADDPEKLIQQLHITTEKNRKEIEHKQFPKSLSKAALALLQKEFEEAGFAFKSAAHLQMARNAHLGFDDVTSDISHKVVISDLSALAPEFKPQIPPKARPEEEQLLLNLKSFISDILAKPGDFEVLSVNLLSNIKNISYSDEALEKVVKLLIETAIKEDNFKYLGAKLCSKLADPSVMPTFRTHFLTHLQAEYRKHIALVEKEHDDLKAIHGFSLFLGEVYLQVSINGQPLKALGRSVSKLTDLLLKSGNLNHIKFSCKLLKLTCGSLYDNFKDSEEDMKKYDQNFEFLRNFCKEHTGGKDRKYEELVPLAQSVLNIRSNQGKSDPRTSSSEAEVPNSADSNYYMNEPVFFTQDGVQYTSADAQVPEFYDKYLSKQTIPCYLPTEENQDVWSTENSSFNDFVPSDEELDLMSGSTRAEYDDDFEKFLQESGQM